MPKTAYSILGIAKRYYENIICQNNKNTSKNTEIITGPVL